jgi:hypothetical protein
VTSTGRSKAVGSTTTGLKTVGADVVLAAVKLSRLAESEAKLSKIAEAYDELQRAIEAYEKAKEMK